MSATTLARLERLLAMVPWLLANPGASLPDLARRVDAGVDEIAADLDTLGYCGVPGYGGGDLIEVALSGGRVTVRMAEYFRRPLRLSREEALPLLVAARALVDVVDPAQAQALRSATATLATALGVTDEGLTVDLDVPGQPWLATLAEAVGAGRVLALRYRAADAAGERARDVEPWALLAADGHWYLRGHCRLAGERRDFRLDRIRWAALTDEPCPPPPAGAEAAPVGYTPSAADPRVTLDLDAEAWWLLDALPVDEAIPVAEGRQRVTLPARSQTWAAGLVASLAGAATVVAPASLARRVAADAEQALAAYRPAAAHDRG